MNETNNMQVNEQNKQGGISMLTKMKKQLKNEKGLTLVELLAVIVILSIIAAIATPAIGNIITNSKYNAAKADALNVLNAAQMYFLDNPDGEAATGSSAGEGTTTSITIGGLKESGYLESAGVFEGTEVTGTITISKESPHKLTTSAGIPFATDKTVAFPGATITDINADNQKGSKDRTNGAITITVPVPVPVPGP